MQLSRRRFAASLAAMPLLAVPPRPKLFVLLVAEQFRSDYLSRFSNLFGPGGFRRLMEEGAYLPGCRMAASSFSSSGLATIATGAYPEAHGIVAESWYDPASKKMVAAHAQLNQADTLAGQVAADNRNRVFATAIDRDRALLLGGSRQTVLALDEKPESAGEPAWVNAFRQSHSPQRFKDARWQPLQGDANAAPLRVL